MLKKQSPLDPRIKRTLLLIREAFVSLLEEKGFDQLTVRDITARADINRATFYLHYRDKYDLLEKTVGGMMVEFERAFRLPEGFHAEDFIKDPETPPDSFVRQFEHVAGHARLYKVMLGPKGLPGFSSRMEALIEKSLYHRSEIAQPDEAGGDAPGNYPPVRHRRPFGGYHVLAGKGYALYAQVYGFPAYPPAQDGSHPDFFGGPVSAAATLVSVC